ncbi:hypothetical protein MANES_15G003720v8, partial [Manihot esculenta]
KQIFLSRIPLSPAENKGYPFHIKRKQFPLKLCYAMTINKMSLQTIPNVGIYLHEHIFSHGQLYVALISMSTTKVSMKSNKTKRKKRTYTKNIIYKEVL